MKILFFVVLAALCFYSFYYLYREAGKFWKQMGEWRKQAEKAASVGELLKVRRGFVRWANKACWHRCHADGARAVMSYIDGKLAGMQAVK